MTSPTVKIGCVANLWSKQMIFHKKGDYEQGHSHLFDHLTLLAYGKLSVTVDDNTTEFSAPQMIYIKAGKFHKLTALEDNTVAYCIHALRDGDRVEDILDPEMIPKGINPSIVSKPLIDK
jgi:quercetin dioxygenase-like cupin family protein